MLKKVIVLGVGNPSRGDDALAPRLLDQLELLKAAEKIPDTFEIIDDFQLQIEHTLDLQGHELVLFIDSSLNAQAPYEFCRVKAIKDDSFTTHALSPSALMDVYQKVNDDPPPMAYVLAIPGYSFELGDPLSVKAEQNLLQAIQFCQQLLAKPEASVWNEDVQ